jgi:hypothetical protein
LDGEELPGSFDAFELVGSAVVEAEACSGDEHWYRGRDPEFSGCGCIENAGSNVNSDPGDVAVSHLDLARMQACSNLDAERSERVAKCDRASDRPTGAVEGGEDAVTRGLDEMQK